MEPAILLLDAASYASSLLLVALGLAIVFGLMGVINMAHGELFLVGAYTLLTVERLGGSYWLGLLAAPLAAGTLGLCLEFLVVRHIYRRPLDTILATTGIAIVIQQVIVLLFGPASQVVSQPFQGSLELGGVIYPLYRSFAMVTAVSVLVVAWLILTHTRYGLVLRGVMADRTMAACLGLPVRLVDSATFALGCSLAGLAGAVMAPMMSVDPQMGMGFLLPAFLSVLMGGGSIGGTVLGAMAVGGGESILGAMVSPLTAQLIVLVAAVLVLRLVAPLALSSDRRA